MLHSPANTSEPVMSAAMPEAALDLTGTAVRALFLYSLAEFQSGHATTIRVTAQGPEPDPVWWTPRSHE